MVPVGDVVGSKRSALDFEAFAVEGVDPVAPPIDEPSKGLALSWPAFMGRHVPAFVGSSDLACQVDEG